MLKRYEELLENLTKEVENTKNKSTALTLYGTLAVWINKTLSDSDENIRKIGYKLQSLQYELADIILK